MTDPRDVPDRFWQNVLKGDCCWEWQGRTGNHGYGLVRMFRGSADQTTHRASYEINIGPIPSGLYVLHTCDNRRCVNPEHLFLGTHLDNIADMMAKGRHGGGCKLPGVSNPQAKLSDAQVMEIRRRYRRGNGAALAREFGVHNSLICRIAKGKCWKHLLLADIDRRKKALECMRVAS